MATVGDQLSQLFEELRDARATIVRQNAEIHRLKRLLKASTETQPSDQVSVPLETLRRCADDLLASAEPFDRAALVLRTLVEAATLRKNQKSSEES